MVRLPENLGVIHLSHESKPYLRLARSTFSSLEAQFPGARKPVREINQLHQSLDPPCEAATAPKLVQLQLQPKLVLIFQHHESLETPHADVTPRPSNSSFVVKHPGRHRIDQLLEEKRDKERKY
jgi:hypothetical protein